MWNVISDLNVRHLYRCPECGVEDHVYPNFFECNGTPMCVEDSCNCDMEYVQTEVKND